jgi:hypothetical protein
VELNFEVTMDGPLFDGRVLEIIDRYKIQLGDKIADWAVTYIRAYLPEQYMYLGHNGGDPKHNPVPGNSGELQASITSERATPELTQVHGDRVVQGAWIEGVSDMNAVIWKGRLRRGLPGRFPGYHTFRIATQELQIESRYIADNEIQMYLVEINAFS